jgi:mitogen-activated protein kinase kinase
MGGLGSTASIDSQFTDSSRTGSLIDTGYISSSAASSVSLQLRSQEPNSATSGASPSAEKAMTMRELEEHLDQIQASIEGREPDVMDLDDRGWEAVSRAGKIVELGSLGEGAGGAVTRCVLKGGKTVFALKVRETSQWWQKSRVQVAYLK